MTPSLPRHFNGSPSTAGDFTAGQVVSARSLFDATWARVRFSACRDGADGKPTPHLNCPPVILPVPSAAGYPGLTGPGKYKSSGAVKGRSSLSLFSMAPAALKVEAQLAGNRRIPGSTMPRPRESGAGVTPGLVPPDLYPSRSPGNGCAGETEEALMHSRGKSRSGVRETPLVPPPTSSLRILSSKPSRMFPIFIVRPYLLGIPVPRLVAQKNFPFIGDRKRLKSCKDSCPCR